ncbi:MAG TPA: RNA polymerase sigma factor [Solirubrobacteraceae bacterium]
MTDTQSSSWPTHQIISAAQQGDSRAIATLLSGSHVHVRRFARTLCSTPEDAEDAAQEALIVLYRRIGTLRASAALASWVFQIVRNECIRRARIGIRRHTVSSGVEPSAEDAALARMELERVVECISSLPPEQRAVLVLRDVQGLSGAATAESLGLSRAAMKSRLHRGREALRERLIAPGDRVKAPTHSGEVKSSRETATHETTNPGGVRHDRQ